ncbi:hypothetical protein VTN96DRAFT_4330 [Rasamsonia emersonii]|uniref:Ribosomal RNA-processing protein 8 n=1 Tax=Rasamsonia emersonii (strain ATCC 16479 / CBS 393.64 / IMI 116815) TaxID=1408163 RepID=A0A0F4Z6Z3_RASE3|nr:Uncharacterized protein T310_0064 [Rasamsonia emersonii CBS 393.64]KKA25861.1 Uncharacterized protein T310_0064 [Rasamsonia emersonii CBS 393.64]
MFAVPGWSVSSADLKQQKEPISKPTQTSTEAGNSGTEPTAKSKSKKRKRGHGDQVIKSNLDEMFRKHIEGQGKPSTANNNDLKSATKEGKKKKKKKEKKDRKGQDNSGGDHPTKEDDHHVEDDGDGKKIKKQKLDKDSQPSKNDSNATNGSSALTEALPPPPPSTGAILTPLQQKMRDKLLSARFRHLNETLYTTPSKQAMELFTANPELFAEYHAGFSRQVKESWPSNPVDGYIRAIQKRGEVPSKKQSKAEGENSAIKPLPRRQNGVCTIADLGCGDAQLARALTPSAKKLQLEFLSYDLHAPNQFVTKADISNLPLADGSVDIAIFCLSLMGTNWIDFVEEAWRVLRNDGKGECWVSEVKSRFGRVTRRKGQIAPKKAESKRQQKKNKKKKRKAGGGGGGDGESDVEEDTEAEIFAEDARDGDNTDETDISAFVEVFRSRGFLLKQESVDQSNKMFVKMEFVKPASLPPTKGKHAGKAALPPGKRRFIENDDDNGLTPEEEAKVLKPCVYKTR